MTTYRSAFTPVTIILLSQAPHHGVNLGVLERWTHYLAVPPLQDGLPTVRMHLLGEHAVSQQGVVPPLVLRHPSGGQVLQTRRPGRKALRRSAQWQRGEGI